ASDRRCRRCRRCRLWELGSRGGRTVRPRRARRHVKRSPQTAHPLRAQPWATLGDAHAVAHAVARADARPASHPVAGAARSTPSRTMTRLPLHPSHAMPSFDIVSEVDTHELINAVDQANRELSTRFDFKGVDAKFEREDAVITQSAPSEFQLQQMTDILRARLIARKIDARCLEFGDVDTNVAGARQKVTVRQGIERDL